MEEEKKKGNGFAGVLIFLLIIALMAESGFIFYDKVLRSSDKCAVEPKVEDNKKDREEKEEEPDPEIDEDKKVSLKEDTVTSQYEQYKSNSFYLHCYTKESISKNESWESVDEIKDGDVIVCYIDFETYADDRVSYFDFQLNYSDGLKLNKVDVPKKQIDGRDAYYRKFVSPISVGDMAVTFEFEATEDVKDDEFIQLYNFVFKTGDKTYYNEQIIKRFNQ